MDRVTTDYACACAEVRPPCTQRMTQEDLLCDACRAGECVRQRQQHDADAERYGSEYVRRILFGIERPS